MKSASDSRGARAPSAPSAAERPIGVFDSGIGGLTVMHSLMERLPRESLIYFGDTARVPYGPKSKETVTRFSIENVHLLTSYDVKVVVVACNTATARALPVLREEFDVPIVGVVGEAYGIRTGLAILAPALFIGSSIVASCARFVRDDIKRIYPDYGKTPEAISPHPEAEAPTTTL